MAIYFLIVFGVYFLMVVMLLAGWLVAPTASASKEIPSSVVSVLVPYRNEQENLVPLLESLKNQNYPEHQFEVILINDQSSDNSEAVVFKHIGSRVNFRAINADGLGKKQALIAGIQFAKGSILATTDADCVLPSDWILSIARSFETKGTMMSLGLVLLSGKSFWASLQRIEFYSVMGVTRSMLGWQQPILCNGANLAFRKQAFETVGGYSDNIHLASGDDEFLLRKVVDTFGNKAVQEHAAWVETKAQSTLYSFFQQRIRWASKWRHNSSLLSKSIAVFVFLLQVSWWPLLIYAAVQGDKLMHYLVAVKILMEFTFLFNVSSYFKRRFDNLAFLALQSIYSLYVIAVGLASWQKTFSWKERTVK